MGLGCGEAYLTEEERVGRWPLLQEDVLQSCNGILESEEQVTARIPMKFINEG